MKVPLAFVMNALALAQNKTPNKDILDINSSAEDSIPRSRQSG